MKSKVLFILAGGLVALAAWYVHRNDFDHNHPDPFVPLVQGGERGESKGDDEVPEKYRGTVQKGLEYLVANQHKDGHWEGDDGKHPAAMTGLVGLALLMERKGQSRIGRTTAGELNYTANVNQAVDWLMDRCQARRDGLIFSEHVSETTRYMEGHGLATLFLAGVYRYEQDEARRKKLTDVLTRAVKYIVKAQSTQGGWYHTSKVEGHDFDAIGTTALQIQALQAAEIAGVPVPREAINDAQEYLKNALGKYPDKAKTAQDRTRPVDTAAVLTCTSNRNPYYTTLEVAKEDLPKKWLKYCQSEIPVGRDIQLGRDELVHYYYAQAMFRQGGEDWNGYRAAMFDHLQSTQNKNGSWPPGDGIGVGPVYSTAMWCIIFQLNRNRHPSMPVYYDIVK